MHLDDKRMRRYLLNKIHHMDALTLLYLLPDGCIDCIVTSPPYYALRDYGVHGQIGLEAVHDCLAWARNEPPCNHCFVCAMRRVFAECHRVLKPAGTLWINIADTYVSGTSAPRKDSPNSGVGANTAKAQNIRRNGNPGGLATKNLMGIPQRVALALQADGFIWRNDIVWAKPNPMPESVKDRCTRSHEYVYMFAKSGRYFFDQDAIREPHKEESLKRYEYGLDSSAPADGHVSAGADNPRSMTHSERMGDNMNPNGKNKRDVWQVTPEPFPEAHFATFPKKLIEPMILAGCPPHVCTACGKPHKRTVEKEFIPQQDVSAERVAYRGKMADENHWKGFPRGANRIISSDFEPICNCGAGSEPGIVLDPFMGSGTTAVVAIENERRFLGSDLNSEYIKMAERRIKGTYQAVLEQAIEEIAEKISLRNADPLQETVIEIGEKKIIQASLFSVPKA